MQPINPQDRYHIANQHTGQRPCSQSTHRTEIVQPINPQEKDNQINKTQDMYY